MTKAVRITVDGASLLAQEGQSLTAALMMAGVSAIRKSPTGESRGALCAMGSCHECRATVDGVRGVRTCLVPVKEGLRVEREMKLPRLPLEPSPGGEGGDAPQIIETGLAVIGAGPAGLAAACVAAELGMKVVIIDESMGPGGRIWSHRHDPPLAARSLA
ncbi:MAG: (2Fe-2S)-binding protein [Planctomycetota bacterium]